MKSCKRYQRKWKKQQYSCEQCKNLPEDLKQKLVEYKKYYKRRKKALL